MVIEQAASLPGSRSDLVERNMKVVDVGENHNMDIELVEI
jgi:hypothetical protein